MGKRHTVPQIGDVRLVPSVGLVTGKFCKAELQRLVRCL